MIAAVQTTVHRTACGRTRALRLHVIADVHGEEVTDVRVTVLGDRLPFGLGDLAEIERAAVLSGLRRDAEARARARAT